MLPWQDRTGHFSGLKCAVFIGMVMPAAWILIQASQDWLGPRPVMEAIHQSGLWAIRFLALTLAITPLRSTLRSSKIISARRMLGLGVLAYAALHFGLYIVDRKFAFGHVASEIASRIYLTIGFVAFCGFCLLGSTSTDRMVARLGSERWSRLHQFIYVGAVIASAHFFMQSKLDVSQPITMSGIFALLLGFRISNRWFGDLSVGQVALVGTLAVLATAFGEAGWYAWSTGAPLLFILAANFDFSYIVRPAWSVLGAAAVLVVARFARRRGSRHPTRSSTQSPATDLHTGKLA
jgi:sulfoxide reductase heme-binding subunit YedZ